MQYSITPCSIGGLVREHLGRFAQAGSDYANAVLGTVWSAKADQWLRDWVDAKATAASRAMDAEYLRTHIGGGWHRLFDGGHDLWGAFKATASVAPDDSLVQQLGTWANELWKDLATPNGLPVMTWDKPTFDAVNAALQEHLGVSSAWVHDMATFTATELGGAVAALGAMLIASRSTDPQRYLEMCGSLGLTAAVAANPLLAAAWVAFVLHGFYARRASIRLRSSFSVLTGVLTTATILLTLGLASRAGLGYAGLLLGFLAASYTQKYVRRFADRHWKRIGRIAVCAVRSELSAPRLQSPGSRLQIAGPA